VLEPYIFPNRDGAFYPFANQRQGEKRNSGS
jgi:hypothetical protein